MHQLFGLDFVEEIRLGGIGRRFHGAFLLHDLAALEEARSAGLGQDLRLHVARRHDVAQARLIRFGEHHGVDRPEDEHRLVVVLLEESVEAGVEVALGLEDLLVPYLGVDRANQLIHVGLNAVIGVEQLLGHLAGLGGFAVRQLELGLLQFFARKFAELILLRIAGRHVDGPLVDLKRVGSQRQVEAGRVQRPRPRGDLL